MFTWLTTESLDSPQDDLGAGFPSQGWNLEKEPPFCCLLFPGGIKRNNSRWSGRNLPPLVVVPLVHHLCSHCPPTFPRCHCKQCQMTPGSTDRPAPKATVHHRAFFWGAELATPFPVYNYYTSKVLPSKLHWEAVVFWYHDVENDNVIVFTCLGLL